MSSAKRNLLSRSPSGPAQEPMYGAERQSPKRRPVDLSSSRSPSSRGVPLKPLKTGNLRACSLLKHTKLDSTVRYLGIAVDDALNMTDQLDL